MDDPDGPSVLGSNGVPYVISNFEYDGQVPVNAFVATEDYLTGNFGQQRLPPQPRSQWSLMTTSARPRPVTVTIDDARSVCVLGEISSVGRLS